MSSTEIFVVYMPIWTSWVFLDRVMLFWFVLSLKSPIAAISQSSVSLALLRPTEAEELHTWCPGYGSLYCGRIPLLPAEQVGVFLS